MKRGDRDEGAAATVERGLGKRDRQTGLLRAYFH